jgi:iron(III) transport system permease protein
VVRRVVLIGIVLLLALVGLVPMIVMLARSLTPHGTISLELYRDLVASARPWRLLRNSLALASLTTVLATALGVPLGVLFRRTDFPMRGAYALLFSLPLLMPPYITALSWADALGGDGLLSHFFLTALIRAGATALFGLPGCALVLTSTFMPVVMLATMTYLRTVNPRLEEAAHLVSSPLGVLRAVTLPLIRPGLILAATLVFLLALGEFSVPMFLRVEVFPAESFTQFSAFYSFGAATAAAVPLAILAILVLGVERLFMDQKTYELRPAPGRYDGPRLRLGRSRLFVVIAVTVLGVVMVMIPLIGLLVQAGSTGAYGRALHAVGGSLVRSLGLAAGGATALTILGFLVGYLIHTKALAVWRAVDAWTVLMFALPSTVVGIGLIALWNRPATNLIYASPLMILLGYLAQYSALTSRATVAGLALAPTSMEEAAAVAGARWVRRMGLIVAPLVGHTLAGAWLIAYIFCLRDTGVAMLIYPPGYDTLPVRIFTLMANGAPDLIAAGSVLMTVATALPLALLALVLRRLRGAS